MIGSIVRLIGRFVYLVFGHKIVDTVPETVVYQEPGQSMLTTADYVAETLAAGGWQCCCGRANLPYISTCTCGMNKRGQRAPSLDVRQQQQRQYQKELEAKLRECHLLHEAHLISTEEYMERIEQITRFGPD